MFVLTAENMKMAEENAHKSLDMSYYAMMDMAGTKCAEIISKENKENRVVILCGKGKNGGDGLVIAFRLWEKGMRNVTAVLVSGEITEPLSCNMYELMRHYPVNVMDYTENPDGCLNKIAVADVIVDAVFGIGFKGKLRGEPADVVAASNYNMKAKKYAVDIPSGLDADGENADELHFDADETLTMIAYKPVHIKKPTGDMCGKTTVIHLGFNDENIAPYAEKYISYTPDEVKKNIVARNYDANKGDFGKVLVIAGSRNMTGCVYLCVQGAVESGAGLVTAAFPDCIYPAVTPKLNEPLMYPLSSDGNGRISASAVIELEDKIKNSNVIAVGCGIGVDEDTKRAVKYILKNAECTVVIDADGINSLVGNIDVLKETKAKVIITPHPGEMSRLTGKSIAEIQSDRIKTAAEFSEKYGVVTVLKGANTIVADSDGRLYMNPTGNPGMSRGGSGDVLTGIISGLVPQTKDAFTAASTAVYLHGGTGDFVKSEYGELSVTPTRVIDSFHRFLSQI